MSYTSDFDEWKKKKKKQAMPSSGGGYVSDFNEWKKNNPTPKQQALPDVNPAQQEEERKIFAQPVEIEKRDGALSYPTHLLATATKEGFSGLGSVGGGMQSFGRGMRNKELDQNEYIDMIINGKIVKVKRSDTQVEGLSSSEDRGKLNKFIGDKVVGPTLEGVGKVAEKLGKGVEKLVDEGGDVDPYYEQNFIKEDGKLDWNYLTDPAVILSKTVGQMAQMAPGLAGGAVGTMAYMGAMETGGAVEDYREAYAKNHGISVKDIPKDALDEIDNMAQIYGVVSGALEAIPVADLIKRIGGKEAANGLIKQYLVKLPASVIKQMLEEGTTESIQQLAQNIIATGAEIDPNRDLSQGVAESGITGAVIGGSMGVAGGINKGQQEQLPEQPTEELPEKKELPELQELSKEEADAINDIGEKDSTEKIERLPIESKKKIADVFDNLAEVAPEAKEKADVVKKSIEMSEQSVMENIASILESGDLQAIKELPEADRKMAVESIKKLADTPSEVQETAQKIYDEIGIKAEEQTKLKEEKKALVKEIAKKGINKKVLQKKVDDIDAKREREFEVEKTKEEPTVKENRVAEMNDNVENFEGYRNVDFKELPDEKGKKVFYSGQLYSNTRKKFLIENDYVLTNDNGIYIDTDKTLTREQLIDLPQELIQNSKNPKHVFLPVPRAVVGQMNLKAVKDKNNIGSSIDKTKKEEDNKSIKTNSEQNGKDNKIDGEGKKVISDGGEVQSKPDSGSSREARENGNKQDAGTNKSRNGSSTDESTNRGVGKKGRQKINDNAKKILAKKKHSLNLKDYSKEELKTLEAYSGAGGKESTGAEGVGLLSEYYTDKRLAEKVWNTTKQYIDAKSVFEPSVGTGNMLAVIPEGIKKAGIEYDKTSGTIAQLLNQDAEIIIGNGKDQNNKGDFQSLFYDLKNKSKKTIDKKYDAVIGNPPFGKRAGFFKGYGEEGKINRQEEYFIKRSLDITKEGGVVSFIVNSSFLSKGSSKGKDLIAKSGELIDAYRLPEGMFADTSIGTDIVVFRKGSGSTTHNIISGNFFKENPEKVLGKEETRKNRFGREETYIKGDIKNLDDIVIDKESTMTLDEEVTAKTPEKTQAKPKKQRKIVTKSRKATKKDSFNSSVVTFDDLNIEKPPVAGEQDISNLSRELSDTERSVYEDVERDGRTTPTDETKQYLNYFNGKHYNDVLYFSGNIYKKLKQLAKDKKHMSKNQYDKQKKGLEAVKPTPKTIDEIHFNPLDHKLLERKVIQNSGGGKFERELKTLFEGWVRSNGAYSNPVVITDDILRYISGKRVRNFRIKEPGELESIKGSIQSDAKRLFNSFIKTGLDEKTQKAIVKEFNETKNSTVKPNYDKVPVIIKGMSKEFNGNKFEASGIQKSGIGFLVNKGSGLIAYGVGVGKTHTMLLATKANMDKGRTKRPTFVVPAATIEKTWIKTALAMFPDTKVVNLGGLTVKDISRLKKERGKDPSKWIKDGEMAVISHKGILKLELTEKQIFAAVSDLKDAMFNKESTKRGGAEKLADVKEMVAELSGTSGITLDDLGIDHISVDEIHNFRKIFQGAKAEKNKHGEERTNRYNNVIGGKPSKQAQKLFLLSQIVQNQTGGNVFLASATPFENHATEVYNILSLIARDRLKEMGIFNINDFFTTYADYQTETVYKSGEAQDVLTMKSYANLQSLQGLLREFIDYEQDPTLIRPNKNVLTPHLKQSALQAETNAHIQGMFSGEVYDAEVGESRLATKTELQGLHLKAITYANANAISPYFINEWHHGNFTADQLIESSPKLKHTFDLIMELKKHKKHGERATFVFMGKQGVNNGGQDKFAEYVRKNAGYSKEQVVVLNGKVKEVDREKIKEKFNNGEIKVLIGGDNTKEGVDLQKNGALTVNVSLGWNPTEPAQVEGRVWRQGNPLSEVTVVYPLVENTGDAFMFQKFSEKGARINDLFSYKGEMFKTGEIDAQEKSMALITDPIQKASMHVKVEGKKINNRRAGVVSAINEVKSLKNSHSEVAYTLNTLKNDLNDLMESKEWMSTETKEEQARYKIEIREYKKRITVEKAKMRRIKKQMKDRGIKNVKEFDSKKQEYEAEVLNLEKQETELTENTKNIVKKYQKEYDEFQKNRKSNEDLMKDFRDILDKTKEHTNEELAQLKADKIAELNKEKGQNALFQKKEVVKTPKEKALDEVATLTFLKALTLKEVEKVFTTNGADVWGKYKNEIITYQKNPDSTTISHEAFHAFLDLFVTERKKSEAFDEIRDRDNKEYSDLEAEEVMAQEFAEWFVSKKRPTNKLQQFFAYLARKLKSLVTKSSVLDTLFNEATNPANLNKSRRQRRKQGLKTAMFQTKEVTKKGNEVAEITKKLKSLNNAKRKIRQEFIESRDGQELIMRHDASQEFVSDVDPQVIQAIRNHPEFRKEKSITDNMADGYLMEKNGRMMLSGRNGVDELENRGYVRITEIDSLASEAGFDNSLEFLEQQADFIENKSLSQAINEALLNSDKKIEVSDNKGVKENIRYSDLAMKTSSLYQQRRKLYKDQESFEVGQQAMKSLKNEVVAKFKKNLRKTYKEKLREDKKDFKKKIRDRNNEAMKKIKRDYKNKLEQPLSYRRKSIKAIQDYFKLSNSQMKRAGKNDRNYTPNFNTMTNEEFNAYVEELFVKAEQETELQEKREEVGFIVWDKELGRVDAVRESMKLPKLNEMSTKELNSFIEVLNKAEKNDIFMTKRELETIKNTEVKDAKTLREIREAYGIGDEVISFEQLGMTKMMSDTVLARKAPIFKAMIDLYNRNSLDSDKLYLAIEKKTVELMKKARSSRQRSWKDLFTKEDKLIFEYLETADKESIMKKMTPEEITAAKYMEKQFAVFRNYLIENNFLESGYIKDYIMHQRKSFLEDWRSSGFLTAIKEQLNKNDEEEAIFNILSDTGEILPLEKFASFLLHRKGGDKYSVNAQRVFLDYTRIFTTKRALDATMPVLDAMVMSATPFKTTEKGLEMDRSFKTFYNIWMNNKKGRRVDFSGLIPQGGRVDRTLRFIQAWTGFKYLAGSYATQLGSFGGEQAMTYVSLGAKKYALGNKRLATKKGRGIIKNYRNLVGKSISEELASENNTLKKIDQLLFMGFTASNLLANKQFLLGSMTESEFRDGKISSKRLAELKLELGRWRITKNSKSVYGSTSIASVGFQFKTWAVPVLNTISSDLRALKNGTATTQQKAELRRVLVTVAVAGLFGMAIGDDDNPVLNKFGRDLFTALGAINPDMWIGIINAPSINELIGLYYAIKSLALQEKYVTTRKGHYKYGDSKGMKKLERVVKPILVGQFEN